MHRVAGLGGYRVARPEDHLRPHARGAKAAWFRGVRSDHGALGSPLGAAVGGGLALAVQRAVAVAPHAVARRTVRGDVHERFDVRPAARLDHCGRAIDVEAVDALVVPRARARVHDARGVNDRRTAVQRERQLIRIAHVGVAYLLSGEHSDDHRGTAMPSRRRLGEQCLLSARRTSAPQASAGACRSTMTTASNSRRHASTMCRPMKPLPPMTAQQPEDGTCCASLARSILLRPRARLDNYSRRLG